MKKLFALLLLASGLMVSCTDDFQYKEDGTNSEANSGMPTGYGVLSFSDIEISIDESETAVRSTEFPEVDGNYVIVIKNSEGEVVYECQYKHLKEDAEGVSLQEGIYSLEVCSTSDEIPAAEWEKPIYGATKTGIQITAGQTTPLTDPITCTLLQCKVTVDYNDDFLELVRGNCTTTVTIGGELTYNLNWDSTNGKITSYERQAGYFDVNNGKNTTMEIKFSGSIWDEESESVKTMRQTKVVEGIEARQWRQVKFVKKINEEGNATFEIVIDGYVEDNPLGTEDQTGSESILAPDPNAPKGDGDIRLLIAAGLNENTTPTATAWNASFTVGNPSYAPTAELGENEVYTDMDTENNPTIVLDDNLTWAKSINDKNEEIDIQLLQFTAEVPNKIKEFYVVIESATIEPLLPMLIGDITKIDLVDDLYAVKKIADVIPFPYHGTAEDGGVPIKGETSVKFILDPAVSILRDLAADGTQEHIFHMTVKDEKDFKKTISLKLQVEPFPTNE